MEKETILKELVDAILSQNLIRDQIIETKCIEFLKACEYSVVKRPESAYTKVKTINDLLQVFYALLEYHVPSPVGRYHNLQKDRKIAKNFVESRMEAGNLSKESAIKQCTLLVELFFKNIDQFDFAAENISFSLFSPKSMGWVTDKLIQIVLKQETEKRQAYHKKLEKEILDKVLNEKGDVYLRLEGI